MSDLTGDARFALRTLVRRPGATLLLVATLALGLAGNAVIFNVLDAVVLRAFAFPNLERLVRVHETSRDFEGIDLSNVAPADLADWAQGIIDRGAPVTANQSFKILRLIWKWGRKRLVRDRIPVEEASSQLACKDWKQPGSAVLSGV